MWDQSWNIISLQTSSPVSHSSTTNICYANRAAALKNTISSALSYGAWLPRYVFVQVPRSLEMQHVKLMLYIQFFIFSCFIVSGHICMTKLVNHIAGCVDCNHPDSSMKPISIRRYICRLSQSHSHHPHSCFFYILFPPQELLVSGPVHTVQLKQILRPLCVGSLEQINKIRTTYIARRVGEQRDSMGWPWFK